MFSAGINDENNRIIESNQLDEETLSRKASWRVHYPYLVFFSILDET